VAEQPVTFVTVTLLSPAVETTIDWDVSPVDHRLPVADDEVSVMLPPEQMLVEPLAVITGVDGVSTTIVTSSVQLTPLLVTVHE
jgi:hypothetical protein